MLQVDQPWTLAGVGKVLEVLLKEGPVPGVSA